MIGSEAQPFAKTGGLADVLGALPAALGGLGWDVTLVIPKYRGIAVDGVAGGGRLTRTFRLAVGRDRFDVGIVEVPLAPLARALLVDVPALYDRDGYYHHDNADYPDNPLRFATLVRAALEESANRRVRPSIVHGHDWHAGLAAVYLKTTYADHPTLGGVPSVFTIHNLAYQGNFDREWLARLDLAPDLFSPEGLEFWGRVSFLKGGVGYADTVTTVSPRYAEEIQTPEFGCGFDGILRARRATLVGILNGIDTAEWDPMHDRFLPVPFSAADRSGKRAAKAEVFARYRFPDDRAALERPLIGMISRMVDQKGFDLIAAVAGDLPQLGARFAVLGTGEPVYEQLWRDLARRFPDRIGVTVGFDEKLAHLIEAGADMFLMPSRFEPCGLNQMYSLRYGTVPIVRAVGGLADTVTDYRPRSQSRGALPAASGRSATGFVFEEYSPAALLDALRRALALFADPPKWHALQASGMEADHSWDRSAREYVKIYEKLAAVGGREPGTRD